MKLKKLRRNLTDPLIGATIRTLSIIIGWFSYNMLCVLATMLAPLLPLFNPQGKRIAAANLTAVFPEWDAKKRNQVLSLALKNLVLTALEFIWFMRHPDKLRDHLDMEADTEAEIRKTAAAPKGALLLTPHLGNWEILGQATASLNIELYAVANKMRNEWIEEKIRKAREYHGMHIISTKGAVRKMLKVLSEGNPLAILMDQNVRPSKGGIFVDFFALPAATTRAPAMLARRLKTDVLIGACVRQNNKFKVVLTRLAKAAEDYESDEELTQDLMKVNESLIRQYPEQYAWAYKRWRYIPEDISVVKKERFPFYARPL